MRSELNYNPGLESNWQIGSIRKFQSMSTNHYKNRHLIIKCKLPLKYLNIDVGEYVRFDNLIDGVKAYGINYATLDTVNGQSVYPLFMCTNIKKTIEYVEIECLQLHHLNNYASASNVFNLDDNNINSVYYEAERTLPDYSGFLDNEIDEEAIEEESETFLTQIDIDAGAETEYAYESFNGLDEYPFFNWESPNGYSEAIIMLDRRVPPNQNWHDGYEGLNTMFNHSNFFTLQPYSSNNEDFFVLQNITSFNNLLPPEYTVVTESNQDFVLLEITHINDITGSSFTYQLKNQNHIIGEPFQLDWNVEVNQPDELYNSEEIIHAAPYEDPYYGGSRFIIKNNSNINIRYNPPHNIDFNIISTTSSSQHANVNLGDANLDGSANIMDLVQIVNHILGTGVPLTAQGVVNADVNEDGALNIMDVVELTNRILD